MVGIILKPWIGHKCGNVHNNRVFQIPYLNTLKLLIFPTLITFADCPSSSFENSVCYFSRFCQAYFNVGHFRGLCHKIFSTSIMQADTLRFLNHHFQIPIGWLYVSTQFLIPLYISLGGDFFGASECDLTGLWLIFQCNKTSFIPGSESPKSRLWNTLYSPPRTKFFLNYLYSIKVWIAAPQTTLWVVPQAGNRTRGISGLEAGTQEH